jgi:hypothetical protein
MAEDVVVQSTYPDTQAVAYPGMPATMHGWDADSLFVETSAGIGFGLAVSKGTSEKGVVIGGTAFVGVTFRDITLIQRVGGTVDLYRQRDLAGICVRGDIWVNVTTAVARGDPVLYNATTGAFGGAAGQALTHARWMRGNAGVAGLAILRLTGPLAQTTVT